MGGIESLVIGFILQSELSLEFISVIGQVPHRILLLEQRCISKVSNLKLVVLPQAGFQQKTIRYPRCDVSTTVPGYVDSVTITDPGVFYAEDTYVKFVGGGGQGAYGIANVDELTGEVTGITMINRGTNYTSAPTVVFKSGNLDNTFSVYTDQRYDNDVTLTYGNQFGQCLR